MNPAKLTCSNHQSPQMLYRYRPLGTSLAFTLNELGGHLWFGAASGLNDPFDGLAAASDYHPPFLAPTEVYLDHIRGSYQWCVACFTEKWDSPTMWSHYAGNHSGICIGYNIDILNKEIEVRRKIIADRDSSGIEDSLNEFRTTLQLEFGKCKYAENLIDANFSDREKVFQKLSYWEYEDEWRLVVNQYLSYQDKGVSLDFHPAITEVLIGPYVDDVAVRELSIHCQNNCPQASLMTIKPDLKNGGYKRSPLARHVRRVRQPTQ